MKKMILIALTLSALSSQAFAETRLCTNSEQNIRAEITETYIGVLMVRKLHRIEENNQTIYRNWLGKTDNGSGDFVQLDNNLSVRMSSGLVRLQSANGIVDLECGPGF